MTSVRREKIGKSWLVGKMSGKKSLENYLCHSLPRRILALASSPGIDTHRGLDIGMAYPLLHIFDIDALVNQDTDT